MPSASVERLSGAVYSNELAIMLWLPLLTSFQIFSVVSGMSMCRTPRGESASTTELTMAGVEPMVPASPTPLTPSGLTGEGVQVWALSIHGIMRARGMA